MEKVKEALAKVDTSGMSDEDARVFRSAVLQRAAEEFLASCASQDGTGALRSFLEDEHQRRLHRYKDVDAVLLDEKKSFCAQSDDDLKVLYANMVRSGSLTAEDAMVLPYLLWAGDEERKFFGALMLHKVGVQRVQAHNFHVARTHSAPFLAVHGDKLLTFPLPLLPPLPELRALTLKLLAEADQLEGGAAQPNAPSVFRPRSTKDAINEVAGGAYFAPVVTDANGQQAVDLSELETYLGRTNTEILRRLRQSLGSSGRSGAARGAPTFRGARGRGGNRGSGRPRGGEPSDKACYTCGDPNHVQRDCPQGFAPAPSPSSGPTKNF